MASLSSQQEIFHVSNRLTFGMTATDINDINQQGVNNFIQKQLNTKTTDLQKYLTAKISQYEGLKMTVAEIFKNYHFPYISPTNNLQGLSPEERKIWQQKRKQFVQNALNLKVDKSVTNSAQLNELMTDFWLNHFSIFIDKEPNLQRFITSNYETNAIQPYALGKFRDLLQSTAQHPSMIIYLDNNRNIVPNPKTKRGLNENYARELMELHTLGVDGGYTQEDVMSLTRILTGWGVINKNTPQNANGFYFHEKLHDYSDKKFLGHTIKGSGIEEVYQVLDILAYHPSTAHHICYKLAQFFVADNPPDSLVKKLAKSFLDSQGNIKIVLQNLFGSDEFWDVKYYANKFKTPYQYVISVMRMSNIKKSNFNPIIASLKDLEMRPYYCVTPDGYKNIQSAWLSPSAMMNRVRFATLVADSKMGNTSQINGEQLIPLIDNFLSKQTLNTVKSVDRKLQSALILGSPEMMYK
ncbi:DUF1800 domain-containing protein [Geminocystis herdmanii]|uniref:DUF1800 domain-containing protein n=1 Tax=Geminocystis herdmanii TaxID=669359 RepID=UPI00034D068D|nr:DUF1800 domain-containing protein [Geminocystis herdmanii]